jgi:hypothetical protein
MLMALILSHCLLATSLLTVSVLEVTNVSTLPGMDHTVLWCCVSVDCVNSSSASGQAVKCHDGGPLAIVSSLGPSLH